MRGARGEAHANEWPGAMMPALPAVASSPSPSFSSRIVTSWPALARKDAVVTPTTPPPRMRVFIVPASSRSGVEQEAGPQRVGGIEQELAEASEVRRAGDLRQDARAVLHTRLAGDPPR